MKRIILIIALLMLAGCAAKNDFKHGVEQIKSINSKYNTTMESYPKTSGGIASMLNDFEEVSSMKLASGQEPFDDIVEYRMLNLEAEKLFIDSQKYGLVGTTKYGFGCKARPLIIESVALRNSSALKGFESVSVLSKLVNKFPKESGLAGLSQKNSLFLNATFYQVYKDASDDSNIINNFCPVNETLEIYKQSFKKETELSEDYINNIGYGEAVKLWKKLEGVQ